MQKDKKLSFLVVQPCPSTILKGWEAVGRIPYSFSCLLPLAVALRDLGCAMTPFRSLPPLTSATNCHLLSSLLFAPPPPMRPTCRRRSRPGTRKPDGQTAKRGERRRRGAWMRFFHHFSPFRSLPPPRLVPFGEKASEAKGEQRGEREKEGLFHTEERVGSGLQRHIPQLSRHSTILPSILQHLRKRHTSSILFRIDNEICSPLPIPIPHTLPSPREKKNHPPSRRGTIEAETEWV